MKKFKKIKELTSSLNRYFIDYLGMLLFPFSKSSSETSDFWDFLLIFPISEVLIWLGAIWVEACVVVVTASGATSGGVDSFDAFFCVFFIRYLTPKTAPVMRSMAPRAPAMRREALAVKKDSDEVVDSEAVVVVDGREDDVDIIGLIFSFFFEISRKIYWTRGTG